PELKIGWQCRQAVPELFHQYRRYGRGKADVARLHPASLQPRHVVAPGLLGSWLGALLLLPVVRMLAALPFAVYLLGLALATAILAHLLAPSAFGMVALALVFITFADVVTDLGLAQALVFFPLDRRRNDAALLVCLAVSGAFVVAAMLAAPLVASFFGHPEVTGMFRVLSLSLMLRASGQVPDALLRKSLHFRPRTIAELGRAVVQGALSGLLAV